MIEKGDIFVSTIIKKSERRDIHIFVRLLRLISKNGNYCVGCFEFLEPKETRKDGVLIGLKPTNKVTFVFNFSFTIKNDSTIFLTSYGEDGSLSGVLEFSLWQSYFQLF